ncbi:biopolymer transporter ExbD [Salinarimonas sp.]|uniref:ExbD/TolR family protein n=1 Tax=Salinarimonas sp. TaxID=2766526 RepID=UPI0032D91BD6
MSPPVSVAPSRLANEAGAPQGRRRALISLTPLIDVVFILLVFFMLTSSFLDWRSIELDAPARAAAGTSVEGALLVEIRPDGVRLAGATVSLETLGERVAARLAAKPEQRVVVEPAPGVSLQEAVRVLDGLAVIGVADLSLIRDRRR